MKRTSLVRLVAIGGLGCALSFVAPGTALADPARTPMPFPPGEVSNCGAFSVSVTPVVDKEYQTSTILDDGTFIQKVTGDLVLQFTEVGDPTKSVVADSPGPYTLVVNPDGTGTFTSLGLGINSFDPPLAAAFGVPPIAQVAGSLKLTFAGPNVTSLTTRGHVTDICAEVAAA